MPSLDVSELNIVLGVLGAFIVAYGIISVKIKAQWYLGEALPAVALGVALGPIAAKFLDAERWGSAAPEQQGAITLGIARVVIGVQLVIAGFQLPAKYQQKRWAPMIICLLPVMTIMWLFTTSCILLTVPKLTLLTALVIGSCVTCTDPILSQAIAKGPFADKYVRRPLRELISSEAGANDGFGFPFLMLAVYLIRFANVPGAGEHTAESVTESAVNATAELVHRGLLYARREEEVGRLGGGVGRALGTWATETWLYIVFLSVVYGAVVGFGSCKAVKFALRKGWIDTESYLLWPTGLGLFIVGTCGAIGTDDLLACFVAGNALNWDGKYLAETEALHDEVNSVMDVILNFGGFMYIGAIMPFSEFHQPDTTGLTIPRLIALGFLVLIFRRIPAILMTYKFMPSCIKDWKEALFMGYFGPIGIGAVFYIEHTKHLFPEKGEASDAEVNDLTEVMVPVVYWLVLFSIIVHGLSIPSLNMIYKWRGIPTIEEDDPAEILLLSQNTALPKNAHANPNRKSVMVHNRFSVAPMQIGAPTDFARWNSTGNRQQFEKRGSLDSIDLEKLRQIR
ncbi:Sodium/hydrogen exchanger family protein [Amylocarpus encephaloides]|uniref:Sodium/hydrogen exchanger family protein n=1 Tax=Amylocarpus encephaloides TaxID=45428 RepID=A0A9P7YK23_9HELO|nr:Sodium/hydrogen exchanger family protein [Amylocarpus encephaloides]